MRELLPDSKFHIGQIVKASSITSDLSAMINLLEWCKEELYTYLKSTVEKPKFLTWVWDPKCEKIIPTVIFTPL